MDQHKLYYELAEWYTTLTAPEDYEEEAAFYHSVLQNATTPPPETLLELGCGAGSNALHMKKHYTITLTDLSPHMLALSQKQNPDCEHHPGDMRTLRLNQQFDAVFIHDAIDYMSTFDDLKSAIETAAVHCKAGGVVMIVPDHIRETFSAYTDHGGNDHPHSMRYLEWTWQPDPESHTVIVDFAYIIRDDEGTDVRVVHDRHICGLFSKAEWVSAFEAAGLEVELIESPVEGVGESVQQVFVARKFK